MKYRFLTEGKDGGKEVRWWRECAGREKPLVVSESVEPCGLRCVALARLANAAPQVRAKASAEQPILSQTVGKQCFVLIVRCTHKVQRAINCGGECLLCSLSQSL